MNLALKWASSLQWNSNLLEEQVGMHKKGLVQNAVRFSVGEANHIFCKSEAVYSGDQIW